MSTLPGSDREPLAGATLIGPVDPDEPAEILVIVRREPGAPAADHDLNAVTAALPAAITVTRTHAPSGRIHIAGRLQDLAMTFGTELHEVWQQELGRHFRHRAGSLTVPDSLDGIITAVLGLDDRPVAKPHLVFATGTTSASYTPVEVATAYQFPTDLDGSGQRVAIIELGGGYADSDLTAYFKELGLPTPSVTDHEIDGATNSAGADPQGADGEVLLDIEVVGAVANGASIDVWFTPNTDQGFVDAVSDAIHFTQTPTVMSISWGGPEDSWTAQSRQALDSALADGAPLGVTITVAAGDSGSTDGESGNHVDFPASSPNVLACGGTRLEIDGDGGIATEVVWNDLSSGSGATGGGISAEFPRPEWQVSINVTGSGRGVPDVAGNADPDTGYVVRVDGESEVIGGTSAVAPLWAGLIARFAQSLGKPLGLLQPTLYPAMLVGFRDITSGNNGAYEAAVGWDACTGLGSPTGTTLLAALSQR